jgi:hypothetical protein
MAPVLRQRSPSWSLRKCRTWVRYYERGEVIEVSR